MESDHIRSKEYQKLVDLRRNSVLFFSSFRSPSPADKNYDGNREGRKSVRATQRNEKNRFDRAKGRIREKVSPDEGDKKKRDKLQCCATCSPSKVVQILLDFISPTPTHIPPTPFFGFLFFSSSGSNSFFLFSFLSFHFRVEAVLLGA